MKLSDIKGERTLDVIAEIIEPIANIAADQTAAALFQRQRCPKGKKPKEFMLERVKKSAPALIKGHREDIVQLLAALAGVTPEAYAESLNLFKLTSDIVDLMTDPEFLGLFPLRRQKRTPLSLALHRRIPRPKHSKRFPHVLRGAV